MARSLVKKVAVVTGGARGIGRMTAAALVDAGALVAIGDIDGALAAQVAAELGHGAIGAHLDVSDPSAFGVFLDTVERELGPLDVLVNNAGIMPTGPAEHEEARVTERVVAINLLGMIHGTKDAIRRMKPNGRGHVINIASLTARVPGAGVATYSATKAGVLAFSEAVSMELAGTGINLSVVQPSLVTTELVAGIKLKRGTPACRPEDVAECVIGLLNRPRFQAFVPRHVAPVAFINQALPAKLRHALTRVARADRLIAEMDQDAHRHYDERMRQAVSLAEPISDRPPTGGRAPDE